MITKKELIIALLTLCLTITLFTLVPTKSSPGEYDPWIDVNDDGVIELMDFYELSARFGTFGTPVNKTALILELQTKIDSLNTSLTELQSRMEALEARMPKEGCISISPAAFTPELDTQTYHKNSGFLRGQGSFYTGVQLPNGATVTRITVLLEDVTNSGWVGVYLMGYNITIDYPLTIPMASVATSELGAPGEVMLYDDTISDAIIDNRNCEYTLWAYFSKDDSSLFIRGVVLEYEYQ